MAQTNIEDGLYRLLAEHRLEDVLLAMAILVGRFGIIEGSMRLAVIADDVAARTHGQEARQ